MKKEVHQGPQGHFKLILHFNIDKTIVMRNAHDFNNTDYTLREIVSEGMWGKVEEKNGEPIFKVMLNTLEYDKNQISDKDLITYKQFLDMKYKLETADDPEFNETQREEKKKEIYAARVKQIVDIVDQPTSPGFKLRKKFDEIRKKLRVDEKIQVDLGLKLDNSKFEEKFLHEKPTPKFNELGEEYDKKEKFRRIFKNSYHKILNPFFSSLITLKKNKIDFSVIFRFFGHDDADIEEFIYEFNCFCDGLHPRYSGDFTGPKVKWNPQTDKKDHRINLTTQEYTAVSYRGMTEEDEKVVFETYDRPPVTEVEDHRENIEDFYEDENNPNRAKICNGYNEIYLSLMEKLTQNCTFVLIDDYSNYLKQNHKHGKLFLVDPYDVSTLQIFFDTELEENPEKIDIIDVVTKKKLDYSYCINKFLINVVPYKAMIDVNYFNTKIDDCIKNRQNEIMKMEGKEIPVLPVPAEFNYEKEMKKLGTSTYLEMTVLPLLHNALTMCDIVRPNDPISFIANFMLMNKGTMRKLDEIIKEFPEEIREGNTTERMIKEDDLAVIHPEPEEEEHINNNQGEEKKVGG